MQYHNSKLLAPSAGAFSTCVFANGFLFIPGQIGMNSSGELAEGFDSQVEAIMAQ